MRVCILHGASQRQELDVFKLDELERLVFAFAWIVVRDKTVSNVALVVDHHNVLHTSVLVVQRRITEVADELDKVLVALKGFQPERDARHDGLFLLDDHARVGADGSQVEVILNSQGKAQHHGQQQQEPRSKTLYLGRELHVKLRGAHRHLTLVAVEERMHSAFIINQRSKLEDGSTFRSSELCIIGYFFIALKSLVMLYLRRSQINVPRDHPLGKLFPPSMLQQKVDRSTKRGVFERAQNCKRFFI